MRCVVTCPDCKAILNAEIEIEVPRDYTSPKIYIKCANCGSECYSTSLCNLIEKEKEE